MFTKVRQISSWPILVNIQLLYLNTQFHLPPSADYNSSGIWVDYDGVSNGEFS